MVDMSVGYSRTSTLRIAPDGRVVARLFADSPLPWVVLGVPRETSDLSSCRFPDAAVTRWRMFNGDPFQARRKTPQPTRGYGAVSRET